MSTARKQRASARHIAAASAAGDEEFNDSNSSSMYEQRTHEKDCLQGLNSRLASYIERVRQLEKENERLTVSIRDTEVVQKKERSGLSDRYEGELARLRNALEVNRSDAARLQLERDTAVTEAAELRKKADRLERDLKISIDTERRSTVLCEDAQATANKLRKDNAYLEKRNAELEKENEKLRAQLELLKKNLEEESLLRAGIQSKLDAALEDLRFQTRNLKMQLEEETKKRQVEMTTVSRRMETEYEERLGALLEESRKKAAADMARNKEQLVGSYKAKLDDALNQIAESSKRENQLRLRIREVEGESGSYSKSVAELEKKLAEMDRRLASEAAYRRSLLEEKDRELEGADRRIKELNEEIARLMNECNELADAKILLDTELRDYESLLMGEESRLNLSQRSPVTRTTVTRMEETSSSASRSGVKRRRISDGDGSVRFTHHKSRLESKQMGPIRIVEVPASGEYIKLENNTDEDVKVGGWHLTCRANGREVQYKFHSRSVIPANTEVMVYSHNTSVKHQPPNYVMKSQTWPGGETPEVAVSNGDEIIAQQTLVSYNESGDSIDPNERCAIM